MAASTTELIPRVRPLRIRLRNFLSYRDAAIELGDLVALVGPNASGKSNLVEAVDLLRGIATVGLPVALRAFGGLEQLVHRSSERSGVLSVRLDFVVGPEVRESFYELRLMRLGRSRYDTVERSEIYAGDTYCSFEHKLGGFNAMDRVRGGDAVAVDREGVPAGQSVVTVGPSFGTSIVQDVLSGLQVVEIDPRRMAELQDASSPELFEPDGSNAASIFQDLDAAHRAELVDELSAIVPAVSDIRVEEFAEKLTFVFEQGSAAGGHLSFPARHMSDGTLRALGILLALKQNRRPSLIVIEEPESAIHLGALQTLLDVFRQQSDTTHVLLTTHSADIIDTLDIDDLRVVWAENGASHVAAVAEHTKETVRKGLITPGELLRADSLDPAGT